MPETKICQNCKASFTIDAEDFAFYEKIKVPAPTWCPNCRDRRRLSFRNGHSLYKKKCDLCGEIVVARVSPDKNYPMYCNKCWWSDKWDSLSYGRDYDFSKPFFEQFKELLFTTPHIALFNSNIVNSDWVNQETDDKNCYLNVGGHFNEDSAYNTFEVYGKDCFDNYWLWKSELCYENINCNRCYKTLFSQDCFTCQETIFCFDCRNCQNCFGCAGLRNKHYYIFNKPYSKEDYQEFLKTNPISSNKNLLLLKEKVKKAWISTPHRPHFIIHSVNSWGDFITESKNAKNCWNVEKVENSKHLYIAASLKDCYDISCFGWGELCYEGGLSNGTSSSKFFAYVISGGTAQDIGCYNLEYCFATPTSSNCFGCCNLKRQEYCILNKKYSKAEYENLLVKIKKHINNMPYTDKKGRIYKYGEFFPPELSPFGYNETNAEDYYPLTKEEALKLGYNWSDYESQTKYEFSDYEIPDDIKDISDDVLEKVLKCEVSHKAYKVIPMELQFYRRMGLPIPRRAPLQRHKDRMQKLLPRKLYKRTCDCSGEKSKNNIYQNTITHAHRTNPCPNEFETSYAPDRSEIVYCEKCYQSEVV